MLHKVRFETHYGDTHVFLDDQEVQGCIKANFDYDINCVPVVELTLHAIDVEVETDMADVKTIEKEKDRIECLNVSERIRKALKRSGINTISEVVALYQSGFLMSVRNFGSRSLSEVETELKRQGLIE